MQYLLFVILAPVAGLVILLTLAYSWQRRNTVGAWALMVYLLVVAGWLFSNTMEMLFPSESGTLFWAKFGYLFIVSVPLAWLAFAFQYAGWRKWLAPSRFWVLCVMPVVTLLLALTTEMHGLVWSSYSFFRANGLLLLSVEHGPWFWVFGLFMYTCLAGGSIFNRAGILWLAPHLPPAVAVDGNRRSDPIDLQLIYVFRLIPGLRQDYSAIAFALAGLFFRRGIFKYPAAQPGPGSPYGSGGYHARWTGWCSTLRCGW